MSNRGRALTPVELQRLLQCTPIESLDELFVTTSDPFQSKPEQPAMTSYNIDDEKLSKAGLKFNQQTPDVIHMDEEWMVLKAEGMPRKVLNAAQGPHEN